MGPAGNELPKIGNALTGKLGESLVEAAILQLGQVYHPRPGLDFGLDGVIELVTGAGSGVATGREIGVQVKRGLSALKRTRYGRTLYCSREHANYWLNHSLPVIIVYLEPGAERLNWCHVNTGTLRETRNGFAIDLPETSDLRLGIEALRALAVDCVSIGRSRVQTLVLPYSLSDGILVDDEELGLASLEFSRAALRGEACNVDVTIAHEADLIASIDAIHDLIAPTVEQRRDAMVCKDILHRYRKQANLLRRALTLLLTEPVFAAPFGYDHRLLSAAIRRTAPPNKYHRSPGDVWLQAWPGPNVEWPIVSFELPAGGLDGFYQRDSANHILIRMGGAGGVRAIELDADLIATRFLPSLALALVKFADANDFDDNAALESIGVQPGDWLIGIA